MFAIENAAQFFKETRAFLAALEPGAMDAVAGAIKIAAPDALETHQDVAPGAGRQFLDFIRKRYRRSLFEMRDRAKGPLVRRPVHRGKKPDRVPVLYQSCPQPFQIRFRAATGGKSAPDESYGKFFCHVEHSRDIPSGVEKLTSGFLDSARNDSLLGRNRHNTY